MDSAGSGRGSLISEVEPKPAKVRLVSLDVFRGITVFGMLLVNNVALDALTPKTLMHAEWSGAVNFADLIFPWFLLAVGVSLPFSMASMDAKGVTGRAFWSKVLTRTLALLVLGWLVDSSVAHAVVIGLGVLQLIGLSYLFATIFARLPQWGKLAVVVLSMSVHWLVLRFTPLPNAPVGTIAEGANAIDYINEIYLAPLHIRGLLSVLTTGPLVLIGSMVGELVRINGPRTWTWLIGSGAVLLGVGIALADSLPMSKPLWTSSYVIYCAGGGVLLLAILRLVFDKGKMGWLAFPFLVFGSNAIVAYVAPILFKTLVLRNVPIGAGNLEDHLRQWPKIVLGPLNGGIVYTGTYIVFWWLILLLLYRRKLFLRV